MKNTAKKLIGILIVLSLLIGNTLLVSAYTNQGIEDFVTRCYEIALGRSPDRAGLDDWVNKLTTGQACGVSVAQGFVYSPEFQNSGLDNRTYIERMYNMLLGRSSDQVGMNYWLDKLNQGESRDSIFAGFANSNEFFALCQSYGIYAGYYVSGSDMTRNANINAFVDRLYSICLGRHGDKDGQANWVSNLAAGTMTGSGVAYGFIFSQEYINRATTNREYVTMLYNTFLGRNPDEGGMNNWLGALAYNSREYVFNGFANSQEFMAICESYGIVRGDAQYADSLFTPEINTPNTGNNAEISIPSDISSESIPVAYSITTTGLENLTHYDYFTENYYTTRELKSPINPLDYTYEVYPILNNFNEFFYIKTDNPDPWSFRLIDPESVYYSDDTTSKYITVVTSLYPDVEYENPATYRVHGGYIATSNTMQVSYYNLPSRNHLVDGGELILETTNTYTIDFVKFEDDPTIHINQVTANYRDSGVRLHTDRLVDEVDYLIDNYTNPNKSFFENMDAIQAALMELAVYPRYLADDRNGSVAYPALAASPYEELSLNFHANTYPSAWGSELLFYIYPYVLDSVGFPGIIGTIATKLNPRAYTIAGNTHYEIEVHLDNQSRTYGGAGMGGHNDVFVSQINQDFIFDGSPNDFYTNASITRYREEYLHYSELGYSNNEDATASLYISSNSSIPREGSWIKVAYEGFLGGGTGCYGYASMDIENSFNYILSNAWVDGRYVNSHEIFEDMTLEESLQFNPSIFLTNVEVTTRGGNTEYLNAIYTYVPTQRCWVSDKIVGKLGIYNYSDVSVLPDVAVLTMDEVIAMGVDRNHNTLPEHGFVYDGTAAPGTPF